MSNDGFSFSVSLGQSKPTTGPPRYIARPYEAHPLGEQAVLLAAGDATAHRVPLFYAQALSRCDRFNTLTQHAEQLIRDFGVPVTQEAAVLQGLEGLVELGLLQSEQRVLEQLAETSVGTEDHPVENLCIRSCGRPKDLSALLRSLTRHAADAKIQRVLVLDDAADPEAVSATADAIAAAAASLGLPIEHIDRGRRTRMIKAMASAARADQSALAWLIDGDADDPEASYGSNLNLALLLNAGRRFLLMDEDALLEPYQLEAPDAALSLRVQHQFETRFPDPKLDETGQYARAQLNPLSAHAELLGQPIGSLAQAHGLQNGHLLRDLSPQMIYEFSQRPRLRLTTNGTLGDTGSGDLLWLFALPASALQAWLASPEDYRQRLFSRRMARSVPETQIAASVSLMTTTLTGIDNRELLLPVGAKGRGEDLIFGALIRFLHPGTPCAALPWMLPHRRDSVRRWHSDDLHRPRRLALSAYLAIRIEDLVNTQLPSAPGARASLLAAWMRGLEQMSDEELMTDMRRCLLERRAATAKDIVRTLTALDPPSWLRTDFERLLESQSQLTAEDSQNLPQLARQIKHFGRNYGAAVDSWQRCWHWAAGQSLNHLLELSP
ncbi:MAG: hypothetical protein ACXIUM_05725 [Wenzhouxiangella sp.]